MLENERERSREVREKLCSSDFFDLQWEFANIAAKILEENFAHCLFAYTNVRRRVGFGKGVDEKSNAWRDFVNESFSSKDPVGYMYSKHKQVVESSASARPFGCFSYEVQEGGIIRIHFNNLDYSGHGPLSTQRESSRRDELKMMFREIFEKHQASSVVKGSSWLYNLDSYTRLFPRSYTISLSENLKGINGIGVWGQFLNKDMQVNQARADKLLECLKGAVSLDDIEKSFPCKRLDAQANIAEFYREYEII